MSIDRWRDFIADAELAWFRVFDSVRLLKTKTPEGTPVGALPKRFASRRKIYAYFRRWFGPGLASNMLANLPLIERQDKLCVIQYDWPPVSMTAGQVQIKSSGEGTWRLHTTLTGGWPDEQIDYQVIYNPVGCRPMIVRRSGAYDDFRYQSGPPGEE